MQLGFVRNVVRPLFVGLLRLFPQLAERVAQLDANAMVYEREAADDDAGS